MKKCRINFQSFINRKRQTMYDVLLLDTTQPAVDRALLLGVTLRCIITSVKLVY